MVGGILEGLSFVIGIKALLILTAGLYLLSMVTLKRGLALPGWLARRLQVE